MTSDFPQAVAAAIDIGSNSIKMTIGRANGKGGIDQLDWASEVVRLGHGLDRTGLLDDDRIEIAIETLTRFAAQARERGATRIVAVATEATRAAANGATFLDRVREETGIDVRVVDGQAEAALTFRGLVADADLTGSVLVADIGGGSTELIAACDAVMLVARSLPLGSGRLTDRFIVADPPLPGELVACETAAAASIQAAQPFALPSSTAVRLIVVGGTGEYMARLVPDGQHIDLAAVRLVIARLATLSAAELADEIDIPEARARVLPAGVAIVAAIASRLDPDRIEISRSGIRAGLLIEAIYGGVSNEEESKTQGGPPKKRSRKDGKLGGGSPGIVGTEFSGHDDRTHCRALADRLDGDPDSPRWHGYRGRTRRASRVTPVTSRDGRGRTGISRKVVQGAASDRKGDYRRIRRGPRSGRIAGGAPGGPKRRATGRASGNRPADRSRRTRARGSSR